MRLDLNISGGDERHRDGRDDKPEGEGEESLLVRKHVQKRGEPGVELVKRFYCPFLFSEK